MAEEFAAKNLTGKGKVVFGEFNKVENENSQFETGLIMDLFFFNYDMVTMHHYSNYYKELSGRQFNEFVCTETDRLNCPELARPEEKKEEVPAEPVKEEVVEQKTEEAEAVKSEL